MGLGNKSMVVGQESSAPRGHHPLSTHAVTNVSDGSKPTIVLNGSAGLVFGELYRRFGLEWAMTSHFGVDIVAHVALA